MSINFTVKLAGTPIGVRALYPQTAEFCRKYICDAPALFRVEVNEEDIAHEREYAAKESKVQGLSPATYGDEYLETLAVYRKIADRMPGFDSLLVHGSALALDGNGYLFSAVSGVGKSTHVALWRALFGERVSMVNDDKPLLLLQEDQVMVCGTPWNGKHHLGANLMVPLKGICFLQRADSNEIRSLNPREGYAKLLSHSYRPRLAEQAVKTLRLVEEIVQRVPLYELNCNMDPSAAQVALDGMEGGRSK